MSNIADLIDRRGEDVQIYRRSVSGTDEFNRPKYTWALQATEKAVVQGYKWNMVLGEMIAYAGELTADDKAGFFKADSAVQDDDQVVHAGIRYDVKAVKVNRVGGSTQLKICVLKRMIE
jgi:hypothetical protein